MLDACPSILTTTYQPEFISTSFVRYCVSCLVVEKISPVTVGKILLACPNVKVLMIIGVEQTGLPEEYGRELAHQYSICLPKLKQIEYLCISRTCLQSKFGCDGAHSYCKYYLVCA